MALIPKSHMPTPSGAPYLVNNFKPIEAGTTAFDLEVMGHIPEALSGRLLRIGPNPASVPDPRQYHWFSGSGMAHGLRLRDSKAEWYRSRYVWDASVITALKLPSLGGPALVVEMAV